jgi:hypothetical protein
MKTCAFFVFVTLPLSVFAHVADHPSVFDTTEGLLLRLVQQYDARALAALSEADVLRFMTDDERHILGEQHWTFDVDVPVVVYVIRDKVAGDVFWLYDQDWRKTDLTCRVGRKGFNVWKKSFPAGTIGLGVNSLDGRGDHYFVAVRAQEDGRAIKLANMYPGRHTQGVMERDAQPWVDKRDTMGKLPDALSGLVLLRGINQERKDAQVIRAFRKTEYVSAPEPDQVVLTWSGDPKTTQTVQWRTDTSVTESVLLYHESVEGSFDPTKAHRVEAETTRFVSPGTLNDPVENRHVATMIGLKPDTTYAYVVGDAAGRHMSAPQSFTTAPGRTVPFSFIYMGDAQNGLDTWGNLVTKSFREHPESKFYILAGDLVDRGNERDNWDSFFANSEGIFSKRQFVPVPGNHEYQGGSPDMYLKLFTLPDGGPVGEKAYAIRYSNALFLMLDSNQRPSTQTAWIEEQLAHTDATWKFVVYHHPAYSSSASRDYSALRKQWGALFDKYHVDVALQGHDHAYLRTWPMNNEKRVGTPAEGTIYIVSVSGTKHYNQGDFEYEEVGMTNVSTFQVLDLTIDGNKLTYHAYDAEGNVRDSFVIEK